MTSWHVSDKIFNTGSLGKSRGRFQLHLPESYKTKMTVKSRQQTDNCSARTLSFSVSVVDAKFMLAAATLAGKPKLSATATKQRCD